MRALLARSAIWALLIAYATLSITPLLWLALAPSKTTRELATLHPLAFGTFENYSVAWNQILAYQDGRFLQWAGNSAWYTPLIVFLASSSAMLAGFALAHSAMPLKRFFLVATFMGVLVPPTAIVLPVFVEISALGLVNTPWALILTGSLFPFGTLLSFLYFSSALPRELVEAATIDGAGLWSIFGRIALPLASGLVGILFFFSFTGTWLNFYLPYVLAWQGDVLPLHVGIGLMARGGALSQPALALAGLITALPVLIVFFASARMLSRGVFAGALKT